MVPWESMTKQHVDACDVVITKLIGRVTYIYIYIYMYFFLIKKGFWLGVICHVYWYLDEIIYGVFAENCLKHNLKRYKNFYHEIIRQVVDTSTHIQLYMPSQTAPTNAMKIVWVFDWLLSFICLSLTHTRTCTQTQCQRRVRHCAL